MRRHCEGNYADMSGLTGGTRQLCAVRGCASNRPRHRGKQVVFTARDAAYRGIGRQDPNIIRAIAMSCQKGKPIRKAKPGDWRCKECGFVAANKKKLCEPKKVKKV